MNYQYYVSNSRNFHMNHTVIFNTVFYLISIHAPISNPYQSFYWNFRGVMVHVKVPSASYIIWSYLTFWSNSNVLLCIWKVIFTQMLLFCFSIGQISSNFIYCLHVYETRNQMVSLPFLGLYFIIKLVIGKEIYHCTCDSDYVKLTIDLYSVVD